MQLPSPDTPPMTPLEPSDPSAIPPFDIRGRLGAGGMGVVYAALSPDNRWVAVKVIRPEFASDQDFRQRFTREVQLMSRIRARCISSVLAFDTSSEQPWFATAFLPGPTLNERVRAEGALPEAKARVLAVGMAEAIAAIHAAGVVHRDLKPANVILAPDGPKVLDFGIARALDGTQLTRTGGLIGSPGWMSPERFRGGSGPEADVFSWGALVAYAVTGRPPFGTGSAEELMFRLLSEEPDLNGVPEGLREIVARALAKDPKDRPSSAELVRELTSGAGSAVSPTSPDEMATLVNTLIDQDWMGPSTPPPGASPASATPHTPPPSGPPASAPSGPHTPAPSGPHSLPPWARGGSATPAGQPPVRFQGQPQGQPRGQPQSYQQGPPPTQFQRQNPGPPAGPAPRPTPGFPPPGSPTPPSPAFPTNSMPGSPRPSVARPVWRFLVAAAAVLLVVGGGTGWFLLREGGQEGDVGSGVGEASVADAAEDQSQPFVFGTYGQVQTLDPFMAMDDNTLRYSRQVFETLLRHDPADSQIVGGLAEAWEHSDDGTEWTFQLREGVRFHDGDDLTAEAVCANFDRWHNLTGDYQENYNSYYWQEVFGGFAENEGDHLPKPNYLSCEASDDLTAVITVDEYTSRFPGAFTLASFGIMSPSTVEEITDAPFADTLPDYATDTGALAGTGPFRVTEWEHGQDDLTLGRADDYWGGPPEIEARIAAGVETVVLRTISDQEARRQALEAGEVHGYEPVVPTDVEPLREAGFDIPDRAPFNVLYLGYQQEANEALDEPEVREALAHAVDRQAIIDEFQPPGSTLATQFVPETVNGWSPDVREIEHSPELAQELLADAGHEDLTIEFCYPNDGSRAYLNDPAGAFEAISGDLEDVGVTVEPVADEWVDYVTKVTTGECPLYLLGWTGDYNDASNFIDPHFTGQSGQFGFEDDDLFDATAEASALSDDEARRAAYEDLNVQIMEYLPGLPISESPSGIVFSDEVDRPSVGPIPAHEIFAETYWR